jgi:hypothetical protein
VGKRLTYDSISFDNLRGVFEFGVILLICCQMSKPENVEEGILLGKDRLSFILKELACNVFDDLIIEKEEKSDGTDE